ncbi:OmpW/AlkL family protein [Phenylobacterium deserti]|uniref:OmpW family protein n=1 Tax=Phenylobacterium deserti TaxID=1914756 RepID=A0A328A890_9CAUL|nr:OmpW family outer membrane protein [Phenylobacterium deserti]RAK50740.1 OmpW family protein [Phenylobacterium deserti]
MSTLRYAVAAGMALAAVATSAQAQDESRWFVHVGPAQVIPDESADMLAGGAPVPGADVSVDARWTVEGEIGYFVTPNVAIAAAAGLPPTFRVDAAGTLSGLGAAGEMVGGPAGVMAQYHFDRIGAVRPYVGAGVAVLVVFDTKDGALQNLKAESSVGPMVQVGADFMLNERWGLFVDLKKAYVSTVAKGTLGGAPVRADVTIDPLVANAGVSYRF